MSDSFQIICSRVCFNAIANPTGKIGQGITGLSFFRFPHKPQKMCVIATTASRIYQFIGLNSFEQLFQGYQQGLADFQDFPGTFCHFFKTGGCLRTITLGFTGGNLKRTELVHFMGERAPKSLAWLTGPGVFLADILLASQNTGEGVLENSINIPYPSVTVPVNQPGMRTQQI